MSDYKTWLWHALFAAIVTLGFSLVLDPYMAALLAWWGYLFRELDQQIRKVRKGQAIRWLDAVMDVVAPALSALAVARWLL